MGAVAARGSAIASRQSYLKRLYTRPNRSCRMRRFGLLVLGSAAAAGKGKSASGRDADCPAGTRDKEQENIRVRGWKTYEQRKEQIVNFLRTKSKALFSSLNPDDLNDTFELKPDESAEKMTTVQQAVDYIEENQ